MAFVHARLLGRAAGPPICGAFMTTSGARNVLRACCIIASSDVVAKNVNVDYKNMFRRCMCLDSCYGLQRSPVWFGDLARCMCCKKHTLIFTCEDTWYTHDIHTYTFAYRCVLQKSIACCRTGRLPVVMYDCRLQEVMRTESERSPLTACVDAIAVGVV